MPIAIFLRPLLPAVCGLALLAAGCGSRDRPESAGPESAGPEAVAAADAPASIRTKSGVEMVLVPAGDFAIGDDQGEDDEKPARRVRISAFYVDAHEVTQESFQAILGTNPAKSAGSDKPVERVSWYSAIQYCNMRSRREGLKPCYELKTQTCDFTADGYRLPTEAEWEYACRAGTATRWSFGNAPGDLGKHGWYKGNSGKTTHSVKQKPPNPWGLYDVHGNVAEWCNDFYAERYDSEAPGKDPRGPASGTDRVLRGGSWKSGAESCRSSARHSEPPGFADVCFGYDAYGFRCVRRAAGEVGSRY